MWGYSGQNVNKETVQERWKEIFFMYIHFWMGTQFAEVIYDLCLLTLPRARDTSRQVSISMRQDILFVTFNKEKGKVNMFEIKLFSILGNWEPGLFSNFDLSTTIDTTGDRNIFALSFFPWKSFHGSIWWTRYKWFIFTKTINISESVMCATATQNKYLFPSSSSSVITRDGWESMEYVNKRNNKISNIFW